MPLLLTGGASTIWNVIKLLVMLVFVLALAYITSKIIARYQSNALTGKSNIRVIESFRMLGDKYIAVVKIGENYYALGIGKTEITVIDKLDKDNLRLDIDKDGAPENAGSFKEVLANFSKKKTNEKNDNEK